MEPTTANHPLSTPNSSPTSPTSTFTSPASASNPTGPKVFDLSALNAAGSNRGGNNFFKNKSILFGFIAVFILAAALIVGANIYLKQRTTTPPQAAENVTATWTSHTNDRGATATSKLTLTNKGETSVTVLFKKEQYWCTSADLLNDPNPINPKVRCSDNGKSVWDSNAQTLAAGQSISAEVSQDVGNSGSCGSAQVDLYYKVNGADAGGPYWGIAYLEPCSPPVTSSLVCQSVALAPTSLQVTQGETRNLTATASKNTAQFTWTVTSTGTKTGTLSSQTGPSVIWTAPTGLTLGQTWTFTATAKDSDSGLTDSSGCVKTLTFTPVQTYTHKTCNSDNACLPVACSPANVDCSLATDCKTSADCTTTKTYQHNICNSNYSCVSVNCPGTTDCSTTTDCKTKADCTPQTQTFKHNVCLGTTCTSVDCSPNTTSCTSSCTDNSQCGSTSNPTHHECNQNNSCVVVQGSGTDQCTSDAMCAPAATAPPIPKSGNTALTIGGVVLGLGALLTGLFLAL